MNEYEVLSQKELELARVKKELKALRIVAPLLREEGDRISETGEPTPTIPIIRQLFAQDEVVIDSPPCFLFVVGTLAREAAKRLIRRYS
jgi:hypothetical protein